MYGKNEKKKMLSGRLCCPSQDKEIQKDYQKCRRLVRRYNTTTERQKAFRRELLGELLGACGKKCNFEPPAIPAASFGKSTKRTGNSGARSATSISQPTIDLLRTEQG